jgi:hypothetical protein
MSDPISSIQLSFGTQLTLAGSSMTGSSVLVGTLLEVPSMLIFANDTNQEVFLADNTGSTKGITMTAGEKIIVDCVTNKGSYASFLGFIKGTKFYVTAPVGTGTFRIGVLTAE